MEVIIIGVVTALNLMVLKMKFEKERYADLALDIVALIILNRFFGGTLTGMMIAMIASAIISTYLYFSPPELWNDNDDEPDNLDIKLKPKG